MTPPFFHVSPVLPSASFFFPTTHATGAPPTFPPPLKMIALSAALLFLFFFLSSRLRPATCELSCDNCPFYRLETIVFFVEAFLPSDRATALILKYEGQQMA